jgi:hypothetical protein
MPNSSKTTAHSAKTAAARRKSRTAAAIQKPQSDSLQKLQQSIGNSGLIEVLTSSGNGSQAGAHPGSGSPLDADLRGEMESRFSHDFSDVRVHTDDRAARTALSSGARAVTDGSHIAFGKDRFAPGTNEGRQLLAHELTHVIQQSNPQGTPRSYAGAEAEAAQSATNVSQGQSAAVQGSFSGGAQRDDLTDEDRRRLLSAHCPSGQCHAPAHGSLTPSSDDSGSGRLRSGAASRFPLLSPDDFSAIKAYAAMVAEPTLSGPAQSGPVQPPAGTHIPVAASASHSGTAGLPLRHFNQGQRTAPAIARLPSRRHAVHVVEVVVLPDAIGSRMFSQADILKQYNVVIDQPDPSAGYNFDTYIVNTTTGQSIPAQWMGGTRFRVFMGTPECPGCHFGHGLEVDLHGMPFLTAMAGTAMNATMLSELGSLASVPAQLSTAEGKLEMAAVSGTSTARTTEQEYQEFQQMLRDEGASGEVNAAGEPVTMQPHGGAAEARETLGLTGENQSAHGLPRSVGRGVPGYSPSAALTTLEERASHTAMDQYWKNTFQAMRRQGRIAATGQEIYDVVAESILRSPLARDVQNTMILRLQDEMFVELEMAPGQSYILPYPNIHP